MDLDPDFVAQGPFPVLLGITSGSDLCYGMWLVPGVCLMGFGKDSVVRKPKKWSSRTGWGLATPEFLPQL